ncbi:MAG: methyltransferase type 11 [Oleiphilus sp.]|nr:MAG: methyltransferase type 11 [Oleiphilus sp.]
MERRLHIGGKQVKEGWELLNAMELEGVDHLMNANDLSAFDEGTFDEIYASHVVEHFDFAGELLPTMEEWHRVLKPGGRVYISVPDLDILCAMMVDKKQLDPNARWKIMTMMFGGHVDEYDYHKVGLNLEFLGGILHEIGYTDIKRVKSFGLFDDTSDMKFAGVPISLNVTAVKKGA